MAATRKMLAPVGSEAWVRGEREQADIIMRDEMEEFSFEVRNDLDWLNEHMGEIFSRRQISFADVFKTPGKLRGKTPRTIRKREPAAQRQPLTDLFSAPNIILPQSSQRTSFMNKIAQFQIAEDKHAQLSVERPKSRSKSPLRVGKPGNTDSGYHGMMTEDEMEIDKEIETATETSQPSFVEKIPIKDGQSHPEPKRQNTGDTGVASDDSFVSAKEGLSRNASANGVARRSGQNQLNSESLDAAITVADHEEQNVAADIVELPHQEPEMIDSEQAERTLAEDGSRTPSEASSPEKPLQRKSSFAFAALPAREPLSNQHWTTSYNGQTENRSEGASQKVADQSINRAEQFANDIPVQKPAESRAHSKSSTQSLHERIKLLGKTKEPRPSKSIPNVAATAQIAQPQSPPQEEGEPSKHTNEVTAQAEDSDDDWIAPVKSSRTVAKDEILQATASIASPKRPMMHQKSISTTNIPSPSKSSNIYEPNHQKAHSAYDLHQARAEFEVQSTTPAGSPPKRFDGPLSASKNKLYSVLKSAKNIFASSASASAAAKLEAHSNSSISSPQRQKTGDTSQTGIYNIQAATQSEGQFAQSPSRPLSIHSAMSRSPSKRSTRSSTESEKKRKAQQKVEEDLAKAREQERQRVAQEQEQRVKAQQAETERLQREQQQLLEKSQSIAQKNTSARGQEQSSNLTKSMLSSNKPRAPGKPIRPGRGAANPSKPAPVSVRVGSQLQRLGQPSSLNKSQHESSAAMPPAKSSLRTTSAQSNTRNSTAPHASRVKALDVAARKREADQRAALKKAEQKREVERELERKRAAKAEEERRVEEERKALEQQRIQEAKLAAQRQAEKQAAETKKREQQRIEQQRILEQQRHEEEAEKARAAHELAEAIKRERAQQAASASYPRGDVAGTLRHLVKSTAPEMPSTRAPIQMNPAGPAKRPFQADEDSQHYQSQPAQPLQRLGIVRGPPSYQQNEQKRRRTNDEEAYEPHEEKRTVMAPPKRPSNMRKESTLAKFPHGYAHAPPPAAHHASSMYKSVVNAQHQLHPGTKAMPGGHPSQMVQFSNARIPFAENSNPPAQSGYQSSTSQYYGTENSQQGQGKFKTPIRPAQAPKSAKSSPMYPNGDSIALPDIATDSEDEDSDDDNTGFRAPSWVASPALRDLLTQQQLVDPETVFGPIGELKMEEVFRNGKNQERLKRFRDRGSSAAWVESGDAVTSAEKRKDMELRERVVREGGWRYDPTA